MDKQDSRSAAIVSTDIDGLTEALARDRAGTLAALREYGASIRNSAQAKGGTVIKNLGASYLVEFPGAAEAAAFAVGILSDVALEADVRSHEPLRVKIGIHQGEIYTFEGDAFGDGVAVASELRNLCRPGCICVSAEVRNLVGSRIELPVVPRGRITSSGIPQPVEAFEIRPAGAPAGSASGESALNGTDRREERPAEPSGLDGEPRAERPGRHRVRNGGESEFAVDLGEIKELIVENLKMFKHEYHGAGRGLKRQWKEIMKGRRWFGPEDEQRLKDDYRRMVRTKAEKARGGFKGHLIPFLAVNAFLVFLWVMTGGGHPWFFYPLGGWGIGLASHYISVKRSLEEAAAIESIPELSIREMSLLQKFFKAREAWSEHLGSNAAVSAYLLGINLITSPGFLWSLIPAAGMAIGVVSHWAAYRSNIRKLRKELKELGGLASAYLESGALTKRRKLGEPVREEPRLRNPENQALYFEALRLKAVILQQSKRVGTERSPLGDDAEKTLDEYVNRIRELGVKDDELEEIIAGIPVGDLDRDLVRLRERLAVEQTEYLRREYQHSIEEIERQKRSYADLRNRKEVLRLRMKSAVNSLKQLQIDLARMQGMSESGESARFGQFKDRTRELSEYLDDLRQGYEELDRG